MGARGRLFAPHDGSAERRARDVGARSRAVPARTALFTEQGAPGEHALSPAGREHFEPIVGASLAHVRVHVDERAQQVSSLARANAVAYGRDVFIPPARYSPVTAPGRELIAHELAHVAQARTMPSTVFRDGPPHYPSEDEEKAIANLLGIHGEVSPTQPASQPTANPDQQHFVDTGTKLTPKDAVDLAKKLRTPFTQMLQQYGQQHALPQAVDNLKQAFGYTQDAWQAVHDEFGAYIEQPITPTTDATTTKEQRRDTHQVLVHLGVGDDATVSLVKAVLKECDECSKQLAPLDLASHVMVQNVLVTLVMTDDPLRKQLENAASTGTVGGEYEPDNFQIDIPQFGDDPYKSAVHEVLHAVTHPAFREAFKNNPDVREGFTEHLAQEVRGPQASYGKYLGVVSHLLGNMRQPFWTYNVDSPEESLRLAYFKGQLDVIGWQPTSDDERDRVKAAGGPDYTLKIWSAATAQKNADERKANVIAAQQSHSNVLGLGLVFQKGSDDILSVRYARIIYKSPYARFQVPVEGQLEGSPSRLGGSLGAGLEFQEPWLYATLGARVLGSRAVSGPADGRIDVSPFLGAGVRLWQRVRIGGEAFALIPVVGNSAKTTFGGGLTVGVEF